MEILPNMSVKDVQQKGTATQKATAEYFDKNGNGILEKGEVDCFQKAKVEKNYKEIKITNADGSTDTFENMAIEHDEDYYSSGTVSVAVIDTFSGGSWHGKHVCNLMKSVNPDIAITKFNNSPTRSPDKTQQLLLNFFIEHPEIDDFCTKHEPFKTLTDKILGTAQINAIEICLDEIIEQTKEGKKFQAVNLSSGVDCSYSELNRLVGNELGIELTPENIADYKTQIKEILETKRNETYTDSDGRSLNVGKMLDIIHKMESIDAPIYVASSYERGKIKNVNINIFALADNAKCIEAGKEQENGEMKTSSHVSSNSLSKDEKTGEKRIENSIHYSSDVPVDGITGVTTSMSTPIALAKDLMKK